MQELVHSFRTRVIHSVVRTCDALMQHLCMCLSILLNRVLGCGCRVVSEWSFKKDGVDAGMIDLANETRGAQLDDRDTFLGIGNKR
jgi:hypothetical protein